MEKFLIIIRKVAWLICLCTFVISCDQASQPPAKPKVIRKKIIAQRDKTATKRKAKKAEPARTKPAAKPPQKPEAPQPQPSEKAPPKPKTEGPIQIAEKDERAPSEKPSAKPAISPKSDIARPQQPAEAPPPEPDEKTLKADTKAATEAFTNETKVPPVGMQLAATQAPRYNPKGKVDPFEPLFKQKTVIAKSTKKKRKKRVPRTPLERIDLSQLKLVAIVLAESGNRAMVEEASGKGYIISKGTYIGTNAGKVTQIQRHKVIVSEEVEDVMGTVSIRKTELKLPKPPGEL
jgi:type IV pilus assembly protein PilP